MYIRKSGVSKYNEECKKTIVTLHQSGKSHEEIHREYGIFSSALLNLVKKYFPQVQMDDQAVLSARQIKALQRRNTEPEEENLI